jgi:hypothetical protein
VGGQHPGIMRCHRRSPCAACSAECLVRNQGFREACEWGGAERGRNWGSCFGWRQLSMDAVTFAEGVRAFADPHAHEALRLSLREDVEFDEAPARRGDGRRKQDRLVVFPGSLEHSSSCLVHRHQQPHHSVSVPPYGFRATIGSASDRICEHRGRGQDLSLLLPAFRGRGPGRSETWCTRLQQQQRRMAAAVARMDADAYRSGTRRYHVLARVRARALARVRPGCVRACVRRARKPRL